MSVETIIAWTDHTFNPWMGCTKISEGCRHCYAATLTKNRMGLDLWGDSAPRQVTKSPWSNVWKWNAAAVTLDGVLGSGHPNLCFCGSLMDLFEDHPSINAVRNRVWEVMRDCSQLHFQTLTKRPENIERFLPDDWGTGYANVWLGTTIEDMRVAHRADILRDIPARVRFVSYEPAIGPVDKLDLTGIHWLVCGGESGSGYRDMPHEWARAMRDKCREEDVAFFFKQSSAYRTEMGIELDGEIIRQFPTWRIK